jgi:hypothetical protein
MPMLSFVLLGCAASGETPPPPASQAAPGFWDAWGDGKAELDGYTLVQPRYGELRHGEAVLIFVTETFTAAQRVKSDGGHPDEFPVIKLNDARHFQTGIYDYDLMTSVFVRLDGRQSLGVPTKDDLGAQEWCGNVYDQLVVDPSGYRETRHSYFDGEGDADLTGTVPTGGVFADAFPVVIRGVAGELLAPGGSAEFPWLPRLVDARLLHRELAWTTATITRSAAPEAVTVPAGTYQAEVWTVKVGEETAQFWVGVEASHLLVKWSRSDGETAELTGSIRDEYWKHHAEGDEAMRARLGLP